MPKRNTPNEFKFSPIDLDRAPFDESAFQKIVASVRYEPVDSSPESHKAWISKLNAYAFGLQFRIEKSRRPTKSGDRAALLSLSKAAGRLSKQLALNWDVGDLWESGGLNQSAASDSSAKKGSNHRVSDHLASLLLPDLNERMKLGQSVQANILRDRVTSHANDFDADEALVMLTCLASLVAEAAEATRNEMMFELEPREHHPARDFVIQMALLYAEIFGRPIGIATSTADNRIRGPLIRFIDSTSEVIGLEVKKGTVRDWLTKANMRGPS